MESLGFMDLLKLANGDYRICISSEQFFPDEDFLRGALYHLQQAIEKVMKANILFHGGNLVHTHNINYLIKLSSDAGASVPQDITDVAEAITSWEVATRYDPYIFCTEEKYNKAKNGYLQLRQQLETCISQIEEEVNEL